MQLPTSEKCICFSGPTRTGLGAGIDQSVVEWRGPIVRGDLSKLVSERPSGNIAIVDGIFHSRPAVGHAEIMDAMRCGWQVWGLSSMGAIRAVEMERCRRRDAWACYGTTHRRIYATYFKGLLATHGHGPSGSRCPVGIDLCLF